MTTLGIDVSRWQPTVDWRKVYASGVRFAFIRATYARTPDPFYRRHFEGAKAAGVYAAAYHFMTVATPVQQQLDAFMETVGSDLPSMPCALDLEMHGIQQHNAVWMLEQMTHGLGRRPLIYTSQSWWHKHMTNYAVCKDYDLWIANYTTRPQPAMPHGWLRWTFWQYTDEGSVDGIAGKVDLNRFNGTEAALAMYVMGTRVRVRANVLNIRSAPDVTAARVGKLARGQMVQVLDRVGEFDGAADCWVRVGYKQWCAFRFNGQTLMERVIA